MRSMRANINPKSPLKSVTARLPALMLQVLCCTSHDLEALVPDMRAGQAACHAGNGGSRVSWKASAPACMSTCRPWGVCMRRGQLVTLLQELDAALADLDSFTDIAFTSRNGIEAVLERLRALGAAQGCTPASALARLHVWALGADAGALAAAGIAGVRVKRSGTRARVREHPKYPKRACLAYQVRPCMHAVPD